MVIYLYGSDRFRRQEKLNHYIGEYRKKYSGLTVRELDFADGAELEMLSGALGAQSLFGKKNLVIVKNLFPLPDGKEKGFKKVLESALEDKETTVLVSADDAPLKAFMFLVEKSFKAEEFPALLGHEFEQFIKVQAAHTKTRLTPQLLMDMARVYAGDSWGVVTELQRLALQQKGAIETVPAGIPGPQVFYEVGKLSRLPAAAGLPVLERLLASDDPAKIFNMLAYQMDSAGKQLFADYDVAIKSGKLDYEAVLTDYVLR